jgi:S1-C subfamily serine protease
VKIQWEDTDMTTPVPVAPQAPRHRWAARAAAVLAIGTAAVLVPGPSLDSAPVPSGAPAVVRSVTGPARPSGAVHRVRAVSATKAAARAGLPSTAQLRTVAAGLVDVDTVLAGGTEEGAGTGIVLTADGTVLTNAHVVAGASTISVTDLGNGRTYRGVVVGTDPVHDVAVLRAVGASGLRVAPLSSGSGPRVGSGVVGIGNAGGTGVLSAAPGVVTGLGQRITAGGEGGPPETLTGMIATTAGLRPGDSGGALVDGSGRVVGLNAAATPDASSGYAIPIGRALAAAGRVA